MGYVIETAKGRREYPSDYPNLDSAIAKATRDSKFNEWEIFYFMIGIMFLIPLFVAFHMEWKRQTSIRNLKSLNEFKRTGALAEPGKSDIEIGVIVFIEFILVFFGWLILAILWNTN